MKYYHACSEDTYRSIMNDGVIKVNNIEGIVYLADSATNAAKFLALRHMFEPIYVFEIDGLQDNEIEEQFDHSETFFKCKAFGVSRDIPLTSVTNIYVSEPNA